MQNNSGGGSMLFSGKKTTVFWVGLHVVAWACVVLFAILWYFSAVIPYWYYIQNVLVPPIVGGVVFILIGLYMMKSGIEKEEPPTVQTS
jgi:xanthine/uracil permease